MIFIIKVTTNKEERAVDMIADRIERKQINAFSVSRPHGLRGYVLLEAEDRESAEEAVFNLPYVKGIIGKTINYEEIKNMIEPSATSVSMNLPLNPFKFSLLLESRLSTIVISLFTCNLSERLIPIKPVPPVTSIFII